MKVAAFFDNSFFKNKPWWLPSKLYRVVCNRANPRSKNYMIELLKEKFPDVKLHSIKEINYSNCLDKIIFLYPDSIGLGWGKINKTCYDKCKNIIVINGRRRVFSLNKKNLKEMKIKKILEVTLIVEIIVSPFLIIYGTLLGIKDIFLRGKNIW